MMIDFIIPAYNPGPSFIDLLNELIEKTQCSIIVVDDGSEDKSIFDNPVFNNKRITLLKHAINLGKGAALKTAFNYVLMAYPAIRGCVTLDADSQHTVSDAVLVGEKLKKTTGLILGVRDFSFREKNIPLKSRVGNLLTRYIWLLVTGSKNTDTQTGLRGIPNSLMRECLHINANRYEFEMEMLLKAQAIGLPMYEVPIKTIYIDNNKESHFNPLFDSMKIYFTIFRFSFSSLLSYIVDYTFYCFFILFFSFSSTLAFVFARIPALVINYNLNKNKVFLLRKPGKTVFFKYLSVFFINTYIGLIFLDYTQSCGYNAFYSKIIVEGVLFFFNFFLQREWVFKREVREDE